MLKIFPNASATAQEDAVKVLASRSQRVFPISECEPLQDDCAHRGLFFSTVHVKTSSTTTLGASPEPPPSPDSRSSRDGWPPKPRHDRRPRVDSSPAYLTAAHTVKQFKMACKRAQQRWSGLQPALTHIAKQVRARLGDALWADFVTNAYVGVLLTPSYVPSSRNEEEPVR